MTKRSYVGITLVALFSALLHMAPYWRNISVTPAGWNFTGNLHISPDYMVYRKWIRQGQTEGPVISNHFTSEPNSPHMLILFYYLIGKISAWSGIQPEWIYAWLGAIFIVFLSLLLFAISLHFLQNLYAAWTVFLTILLGGGLGAYLRVSRFVLAETANPFVKHHFVEPLYSIIFFDEQRAYYVFNTLFDTHYIFVWLIVTLAVLLLYFSVRNFSYSRAMLTGLFFCITVLFHVYQGITLMAITLGTLYFCHRKGFPLKQALFLVFTTTTGVIMSFIIIASLYSSSGIPPYSWREPPIFLLILLISYPLAWPLIVYGLNSYWKQADMKEAFVVGWAAGCTLLTLSAPFYSYPGRGTTTLQIALYLLAGGIYFGRWKRITFPAALLLVVCLGASPLIQLQQRWVNTRFDATQPSKFQNDTHRGILNYLQQNSASQDILLCDFSDRLWLAPEFPGRLYAAHYFLTINFEAKRRKLEEFFVSPSAEFLRDNKIRFVYVAQSSQPERFAKVPELTALKAETMGTLFEFRKGTKNQPFR